MKRFDEKVRDIVEVRSPSSVSDFLADPADTLAGYHFTDITAELMAKWLDRVADVKKGSGAALALAGFRGVGKSHFLAALGAIVSQPELRAAILDQHVAASAQRLSRRHGVVAHVRRGSGETLIAELKDAIAEITGTSVSELSDSIGDLMAVSAAKSGDMPPVIVIDTAFGREARVTRDDGVILSEISAAALGHGIFVGIALDDDIAGADGINSSIAGSFDIDYLDQEHLYKIVNAHVFTKNEQMRPVLHEIYESYRASMPGFRWSESRFSSLYPLHPAILEIAPFVRLYLQDFALLGFASAAAVKILRRPANSLIGLDEVFDNVEERLRDVDHLRQAFAAYDSLDRAVVAKTPVMERHEVKLVLKGLFLISLTGDGTTASELAAAMLIFDEHDTSTGISNVEASLRAFSNAMPGSIRVSQGVGGAKYALEAGSEDDVNAALNDAIANVPVDVVWPILRRQTAEKFNDFATTDNADSAIRCDVIWRGAIRRGEIIWTPEAANEPAVATDPADWRVFIGGLTAQNASDGNTGEWKLGVISSDDIDTLRRFHVLQTDAAFREKFRDSISTALHVHSIAVEKIWQRTFLEDGRLILGGREYPFSDQAVSSHTLSQLLTPALDEHFTLRFPSHPEFADVIEERRVSRLVEHLFSGSTPNGPEIQKLAADLALPLGLVVESEEGYQPSSAAELLELPIIKDALGDTAVNRTGVVGVDQLSERMRQPPYGLTREAQHLVLAALVGQREFEFVTSSGNRINHRSLNLQIVWDDIVGLAPPSEETYSSERLMKWAAVLTGNAALGSVKASDVRLAVIDALSIWLAEWQVDAVLERFDALPDEKLNTRIWRIAINVRKTFGIAAASVDGLLQNSIALDQCLQSVADAFSDSEDEFQTKSRDLAVLRHFIGGVVERDEINDYLILAEPTYNAEIDGSRASLLEALAGHFDGGGLVNEEFRATWLKFKALYTEWYAERHQGVMTSSNGKLDEFLATPQWATFSDLSAMAWFGSNEMEYAMTIVREIRSLRCTSDVREALVSEPFCTCSFSLPDARGTDILIEDLRSTVAGGLENFRQRLLGQKDFRDAVAKGAKGKNGVASGDLGMLMDAHDEFPSLSALQMQSLKIAAKKLAGTDPPPGDHRRFRRSSHVALHADDIRELEDQLDRLGPA